MILTEDFIGTHWKRLYIDRYWNDKEIDEKYRKKGKSSYSFRKMVYKILKIDCQVKIIANYICNHGREFETFSAIILWFFD